MKIVIITPTRNEEKYIRTTIECMIKQTVLPIKWVIVNDGSTDKTGIIIQQYIEEFPFIEYVSLEDRGYRHPGKGVVEAFYEGYKKIEAFVFDIVAKFDSDLEFPPDTLEKICQSFKNDQYLGIVGGAIYEQVNNQGIFKKLYVPEGYVCGINKFYRKKCFEDIGGLIFRAGWDGVDNIRANMKGWKTGEVKSLTIHHLKLTGTAHGEGLKKACEKYGDISYYMGGYIWYFILRMILRSIEARNPKVGYFMLQGYLNSFMKKEHREPEEFREFLKRKQLKHTAYLLTNKNILKKVNYVSSKYCDR